MIYETYKRTMATDCKVHSEAQSTTRKIRQATARHKRCPQRHTLDSANRRTMVRITSAVSAEKHLPQIFPAVEQIRSLYQNTDGIGPRLEEAWRYRHQRKIYRWNFCTCKKTPCLRPVLTAINSRIGITIHRVSKNVLCFYIFCKCNAENFLSGGYSL